MILKMGNTKTRDLQTDTGTRCPICGDEGEIAKKGYVFCNQHGYVLRDSIILSTRRIANEQS